MADNDQEETPRRGAVGVDSSENSARAARWAAREADSRGLPLVVAHVVHLPTGAAAPLEPRVWRTVP